MLNKSQHPFTIKALSKLGLERNYKFKKKTSANIILNGEEVKHCV